ncbi:MAG: hypothetical protein NC489_47150 [Ruminococcus flavefaciens]|nr:hypothetical protein [Ruminococcus flavefaciens]
MHTKTMEGLIGARMNMELLNTPFRVYKDAERRGDLGKMEQAMGYVSNFQEKAYECKEEADEGMKEDAKEVREKAEEIRKETDLKRKKAQEKLEERIEERRQGGNKNDPSVDTVTISEEGKVLLKENTAPETTDLTADNNVSENAETATEKEPVIYTASGNIKSSEPSVTVSVTV